MSNREGTIWTDEELAELFKLASLGKSKKWLAEYFGRTENAIYLKLHRNDKKLLTGKSDWSEKELEQFKEMWGNGAISMNIISNQLHRSKTALKVKAQRLGLGPRPANSEYLTIRNITEEMQVSHDIVSAWIKNKGLKTIKCRSGKTRYMIETDVLLKFLKDNPEAYDASKISKYLFSEEPQWLQEKRKADLIKYSNIKNYKKEFSNEDDKVIQSMFILGKSDKEIAKKLGRTTTSIQGRRLKLFLMKGRYTDKEINFLKTYSPYKTVHELSEKLGRPIKGIEYKCNKLNLKYHFAKDKCDNITNELEQQYKNIRRMELHEIS